VAMGGVAPQAVVAFLQACLAPGVCVCGWVGGVW
jgi:hypothetical protein